MTSQFTLPPDTRAIGTGNPPADMNAVIDAVTALGAGQNVLNAAFSGGADLTGAADSAAAFNAAIPAGSGFIYVPAGTYKIGSTVGPFTTNQWVVCAPGVVFNFTGTGDCFRFVDTSTYTTRTRQGGGIIGRPIIDGTSAGAGSSAVHAGDILALRVDVAVQNFSGAGSIGVHFDNQNFWTEQAVAWIWTNHCTQDVVFDCGGATTSQGSYDRGDFTIYVQHTTFTGDSIVFQNGAYIVGGRLRIFGNWASSSSPFTQAVLKLTGSAPGGHVASFSGLAQCDININVESDGALVNTFQTVTYGSTSNSIIGCSGNVSFGPGNQFTGSNITTLSSQFTFVGPVTGDNNLNESSFTGRVAVPSQAFFFSSVYVAEIGSPPSTPAGGGYFYVDANGLLHYLGPGAADTILARAAATTGSSVSFTPANPASTTSATAVMMGLGSTCTFTPATSGKVRVTMCGTWYTSGAAVNGTLAGRYGTGTAPVNGAAASGTRFGTGASDAAYKTASTGFGIPFSITQIVSLTVGTAYWFDLAESVLATGTTQTGNVVCTIDELAA